MRSMPIRMIASLVMASIFLVGCGPTNPPVNLIIVIDLTSSVEAEAQAEAFDALQSTFKSLQRGDSVTIIPITGDAATQASGRVIRLELSEKRESYDQDIRRFIEDAKTKLQELRKVAAGKPYTSSDILGAASLASEELPHHTADSSVKNIVVFLTDFIQDDAQFNFKRDSRLANDEAASEFAKKLAESQPKSFTNTAVYIGLLRSKDLRNLSHERRSAINAFWMEYFKQAGSDQVVSATDGSGRLSHFLKEHRKALSDAAKINMTLATRQKPTTQTHNP